ncbi:MAG: chitinase [Lachnospiraceae bacterium]|nr:chitinase [Lachnospiraceae bacterium]
MADRRNSNDKKPKKGNAFLEFFSDAGDFAEEEAEQERKERAARRAQERKRREQERELNGEDRYSTGSAARNYERHRSHKKQKKTNPVAVFVVLVFLAIILVAIGLAGKSLWEKYSYSTQTMDLAEYFGISGAEDVPLIIGGEVSDVRATQRDGALYLPLSFVQKNINSRLFFDKGERKLLYTTPTELNIFEEGQASGTGTIWINGYDEPLVEVEFVKNYGNFSAIRYENPLRLVLYFEDTTRDTATITKHTQIRYQGGVKSDVLCQIGEGESVVILEQLENWDKVEYGGIIGYLEKKKLSAISQQEVKIPQDFQQPVYTSQVRDHKINMAWHQVTNQTANDTIYDLLAKTQKVNVVSPTWYFLSDDYGNFTSIVSDTYVQDMHDKGIEVWALADDFTNQVDMSVVLGSLTNRQNLISHLVEDVVSHGIDGINIDFEKVPAAAGEDFVEFIRELSIACRQNALVLSIDNYVPTEYTDYYNRSEQGAVADYVVIMGYDEHYGGSQEAGSVASLGYVQNGIEKTIAQVPPEKVINGIPFYTRFWRTGDDGTTSENLTMGMAQQSMDKRGITPEWDDTTSQYYASFDEDGKFCQIWLEEERSIRAKLLAMSQYNLGGVAEWKLGQEQENVWNAIAAYMDGTLTAE